MNHSLKYIFVVIALLGIFNSCSKEEEEDPDMRFDYFPVEQGAFVSYQVQSIIWDDFTQTVDTTYYQIKMVVDTSFTDNLGRLSYSWNRYFKTDSTAWQYDFTYAFTKTHERVETLEGNNRYIRLAFPVRLSYHWDMNAFNTQDALEAKYVDVDVAKSIGGFNFSSCAIVLIEDNSSLINEYYQEELYARGVGMVERTDIHVDKLFSGEITKGYKYFTTVSDYGYE